MILMQSFLRKQIGILIIFLSIYRAEVTPKYSIKILVDLFSTEVSHISWSISVNICILRLSYTLSFLALVFLSIGREPPSILKSIYVIDLFINFKLMIRRFLPILFPH